MPASALRACPAPGCPNFVRGKERHCPAHQRDVWRDAASKRPEHHAFYSTSKWRKLRNWKVQQNPVCEACNAAATFMVDHIIPIADGGSKTDVDNLQSLCRKCHEKKTTRDVRRRKG